MLIWVRKKRFYECSNTSNNHSKHAQHIFKTYSKNVQREEWQPVRRSRCRRSFSGEPASGQRRAGASRSPRRLLDQDQAESPRRCATAVEDVRRATESVKLSLQSPAFDAALSSACADLMGQLLALPPSGSVVETSLVHALAASTQAPAGFALAHLVFLAAGGRMHSSC